MRYETFDWLVIGAGPSGLSVVGKLLDHGVAPEQIGWVDPKFQVGDLGAKWYNVPGNTKVELFLRFLSNCTSFMHAGCFAIDSLDPQETCLLQEIVDPLQAVTKRLTEQVISFQTSVDSLLRIQDLWHATLSDGKTLKAASVVLAVGSEPKTLSHTLATIPLQIALNPQLLSREISPDDRVAVFGSSHSAVLALANLLATPLSELYNFYRTPHRYAVYYDDWILYDDTGLKGFSAQWARTHVDGPHPAKLQRLLLSDPAYENSLARCNKAVYAIGFEPRRTPTLEQFPNASHCNQTGVIAPRLFGCGIAYPQDKNDRLGNPTQRIGLWKFIDDLNRLLPLWLGAPPPNPR